MTDRRDNAPPPEGWALSPAQRDQLVARFRAGIGSRPANTPAFRAHAAEIGHMLDPSAADCSCDICTRREAQGFGVYPLPANIELGQE